MGDVRSCGWARIALLTAVWISCAAGIAAQGPSENPAQACAAKNQTNAATVGAYVFTAYKSSDGACVTVANGGTTVYSKSVDSFETFTLGQPDDAQDNIAAIPNGADVTGRGQPDMVVSLYTGGAHCCSIHYVFELGPQFKLLATLNDADDDLAHFESEPDGRYDYVTGDWTFGYWPTCFACSPSEVVLLRWTDDKNGGGFHLDLGRMKKPAPTTAEWNKDLSAAQKVVAAGDADSIGTTMWQTVLDLLYSDNSQAAWKFIDALGPKAQQAPLPTLADFCGLLKTSPYWPDLQPTLADTPHACANAPLKPSNGG
ncbi:MAG TPA: hypothetical protein VMT38_06190 [Terracidiphilus sp.]|nr:hypothetical protein [Terracidiphilus sp.]